MSPRTTAAATAAAAVTTTVVQPQTPPPSTTGSLSARPSLSSPHERAEKKGNPDITPTKLEEYEGQQESETLSDNISDWDSDDSDQYEVNDNDNNDENGPLSHQQQQQHPPLHIPDITWRPDLLLPPTGIFHPSHFLTDENWELWHNNWLSILLANGVPTTTSNNNSSPNGQDLYNNKKSSRRFLLSIRDDCLLGAYMRMTMTPEVLRGNPRCENQLVEFVSARDLWRWLPITMGDFSSGGGGRGTTGAEVGGGTIRIVRADQPWRIRGRRWTRFGRVVDVEALREGQRYDR